MGGFYFTHAHEDHIGGIEFLVRKLKNSEAINKKIILNFYATPFTGELIKYRLNRAKDIVNLVKVNIIKEQEFVNLFDDLEIMPIYITHSITDSCCLVVRTKNIKVFFTGENWWLVMSSADSSESAT